MLKYILISFLIITNVYAYTCEEMGYTKSIADCPDGGLKCPAQPEKMFCCDPCGDGRAYMYDERNCSSDDGLQLAGVECGGRWSMCRECTSEYKYNKDNCRSPKILAGVQCANSYTQCVYPVGSGCVPTVGYIYYSDDSCHAEYDDTKTPVGIIVDAARKTIVALDEQKLPWNDGTTDYKNIPELKDYLYSADAQLDVDGQNNTDKIITFALSSGQEHKAAQYCANKTEGNKKWYLPALGELIYLYNNITTVQDGLKLISGAMPIVSTMYSTSTEYGLNSARRINLNNGYLTATAGDQKNNVSAVRCFSLF